jgi:serine palmitoyltransferase
LTELLNIDATSIDIIIGSLAGCVSSAGGFCTGASLMVEHQRLNSPAVTFSASLPTFLTTTASEVITRLQSAQGAELLGSLQDRTAALRHQLAQSDWVRCTSAPQNPVIMLVLKEDHVLARSLSRSQQETLLQECVDEVSCNSRENMDAEIGLTIVRRPCPVTTFLSHALRPCRSWKV